MISEDDFLQACRCMIRDLESNRLRVVIISPCRVAVEHNPLWYREFCSQYQSGRKRSWAKFDTAIKRQNTIRALERMSYRNVAGLYAQRLAPIVIQWHEKMGEW